MAKVSVIIPVYQAERYLPQCLESVSAQTLQDMEAVVVDDGSTDGSGAICDEYAEKDRRIRVIHQENRGVVPALIAGLSAAAGEYIGFVDADDWVDPDYFETLLAHAVALDADVVQAERIEEGERPLPLRQARTTVYETPAEKDALMDVYYKLYLCAPDRRPVTYARWDKLYRRDLVQAALPFWDRGLYLAEDAVFNAAVLPDCRRFAVLSGTPKYHYRILPGSNSHRFDPQEMSRVAELRAALLDIAAAKGTDPSLAELYMAHAVYYRIYAAAIQPGGDRAGLRRHAKALLASIPAGSLRAYAASRRSPAVRLSCALLRAGAIGPFTLLARLNERLVKRKK